MKKEPYCECCEKNSYCNSSTDCTGYKTKGAARIPKRNFGDRALFKMPWQREPILCEIVAYPNVIGKPGKDMVKYLVRDAKNTGAHARIVDEDYLIEPHEGPQ